MKLEHLIEKYNKFYLENKFNIEPTTWKPDSKYISDSFNETNFRGENAYVWQEQCGDDRKTYKNYYRILKKMDRYGLLGKTKEDGSYGCITYKIDDILVSRDLLDSLFEIYFLKSVLPTVGKLTILEIGAGYGRLCKRFTDIYPESNYYVVDAIPQSTYFSSLYLGAKNKVLYLHELEEKTKTIKFDLVINIHSFPECNIKDIEWWIKFINMKKIKYIFYVPNNPDSTTEFMPTNNGESILELYKKYGYEPICYRNMYKEFAIKYSFAVPFFILVNNNF